MDSEEFSNCDELNFETQTDIITLLENIRCQTNNSSQRQAFVALATILNLGEECQNYFREAGGLEAIKGQLIDGGYKLSMVPVALFCLACAIKDNVTSKMDILSMELLSLIHTIFVSVRNQECLQSAAFFLACLVSGNVKGQHLASRTGCVEDLVMIIRDLAKDGCKDEKQWMTITRSVSACIGSPQNENNQRVSSCMIPHILKVVTDWSDRGIVQHALSMIGLVLHNNVSNQNRFRSCGGIDILSGLITKLVAKIGENVDEPPHYHDILISAITTLDFAVAENEQNVTHAIGLGLVPKILCLFQYDQVVSGDMRFPLLVLAHFMEHAEQSCDPATVSLCQQLMVKFLTETESSQDDELLKLIKYILSLCKEIVVRHGHERHPQELRMDRNLNRLKEFEHEFDAEKPQRVMNSWNRSVEDMQQPGSGRYDTVTPAHCSSANKDTGRDQYRFAMMSEPSSYLDNEHLQKDQRFSSSFRDGRESRYNGKTDVPDNNFEIIPNNGLRNSVSVSDYFGNKENFNQERNQNCDRVDNSDGPGSLNNSDVNKQSFLDTSLSKLCNFISGLHSGESEAPGMLTLMALQEKQIQMFSEIQKLISTVIPFQLSSPANLDETTSPLQQLPNDSSEFSLLQSPSKLLPPHPRPSPRQPSHTEMHQSEEEIGGSNNCNDNLKLGDRFQPSRVQNVSQISNVEASNDNKKQVSGQSSYCSRCAGTRNDKDDKISRKSSDKSSLNRSIKSVSSSNILSACNTNRMDEDCPSTERPVVKDTSKSKTMNSSRITQISTHNHNNTDGRNNGNESDDSDSKTIVSSSSTIDFTSSPQSDFDRTCHSLCKTSTPKHTGPSVYKRSRCEDSFIRKFQNKKQSKCNSKDCMPYINASANLSPGKESSNRKRSNKTAGCQHQTHHDDDEQIKLKSHSMSSNVRKVKSIPSIQVTSHANIFGETSVSSPLSTHSSCRKMPKTNVDLNDSFQSAVKDLFISKEKSRKEVPNGKDNDRKIKSSFYKSRNYTKSEEKMNIGEDMDSGFGGGLEHDSENIEMKDNCPKREKSCSSFKTKNETKSRSVNRHVPKVASISEYTNWHKEAVLPGAPMEDRMMSDRKEEAFVPKCYFFTPQLPQTSSWSTKKQMYTAGGDVKGAMMKSACSDMKKLCKEDLTEVEMKNEKGYRYNNKSSYTAPPRSQSMSNIVKKDLYAFPSDSESAVYPTTPESDISPRSLEYNLRLVNGKNHRNNNTRRSRMPYSDQEILNLRHGVATLGTRWQQIVAIYQFHPSRTAVDLREKFKRLMQPSKQERDKSDKKCEALPFSSEEVRRLMRGVKMFGHNWKAILAGEKFLPGRTHQDLRNKWRTFSKTIANRSY